MKFRAHDTFAIRKGWLNKGLRNIEKAPDVFISKDNNPMDVLGIGANMVKSLRYWLHNWINSRTQFREADTIPYNDW